MKLVYMITCPTYKPEDIYFPNNTTQQHHIIAVATWPYEHKDIFFHKKKQLNQDTLILMELNLKKGCNLNPYIIQNISRCLIAW